ncbi:MAG: diphthine--ammonia ligase [Candidatus Omnitrophota bacterium]
MNDLTGVPFFCSWSGGKDSCLALFNAIGTGGLPRCLLTMCIEDGSRTRSHGLAVDVIRAQSESLNIPLILKNTSWADYETNFVESLRHLKNHGIEHGVFGDIDIDPNREWEEKVCRQAGVFPHLPLWKRERTGLLHEFMQNGFKALIVAANAEKLGEEFLGRMLDEPLIDAFKEKGIDPSGEEGEYHTVVIDGPIFSKPLDLQFGGNVLRSGYWFKDFCLPERNS